jgi:hypothetical protein
MSSPILTFCSAHIAFLFLRAAGVLCQINLLIQAHSFLARSHTARHASTFSSEGAAATCSASSSTARSSFLQKGNCACGDGCKFAFDGAGETERRGTGGLSKKQNRRRELLPPPNPSSLRGRHRFRRLPSPRGQCGRRKRRHEHSPTPSAPAPTLHLLTPPPRYAVSTAKVP